MNKIKVQQFVYLTNNNIKDSKIIELKPQNDKENPIKIIFENQGFGNSEILIDSKESIDELIRFYFEINERLDLYGDESIRFLISGECIQIPYPKKSVGTLINTYDNFKTIKNVVIDNEDKMRK